MMVWQLLQVRHVSDTPLIFVGRMWEELVDWGRKFMLDERGQLASPEDFDIPACVNTAGEVIEIISKSHAKWSEAG
jgi:predicted Rossmann-fold nucleotide-binding protein